jgi:dihydroneopterin aldolase
LPSDRIVLKGMQFYGFHGANPEERTLGQSYQVDLAVELDLSKPGETDRLPNTVSYTHLYRIAKTVLEGESKNLLEAIAHSIAQRVLEEFPVAAVRVTVKKPHPPIQGSAIDYAAVEVYRTRE